MSDPTTFLGLTLDLRGRRVLAELKRRADTVENRSGAAVLLVLDNVSETALLSGKQMTQLPREDWLRVIVTTRLGVGVLSAHLQKSVSFIAVDQLPDEDGVKLFKEYQPRGEWPLDTAAEDEAAALTLVRELGGFTLALEQVAIYLGEHPELRPAAFLARLRREGLPSADSLGEDPSVAMQMQHRKKQLGLTLATTLQGLGAPARTALDYAALLPPDSVPWPWLRAVVEQEHPNALRFVEGYPDPWAETRQQLTGMRLLTAGDHPEIPRMHRLVGAHLVEHLGSDRSEAMRSALRDRVEDFALDLQNNWEHGSSHLWMLRPLQYAVDHWSDRERDSALGHIAMVAGEIEATVGRIDRAAPYLFLAVDVADEVRRANPDSSWAVRDVSVSLERLADFLASQGQPGDLERELVHYTRSLDLREQLLQANPQSAQAVRDVSVSLDRLADLLASRGQPGDVEQALVHSTRSLDLSEQLMQANPRSAQTVRDVSVSLDKLADLMARRGQPGDEKKALMLQERSLSLARQLYHYNPLSLYFGRTLAVSYYRTGALAHAVGEVELATDSLRGCYAVLQELIAAGVELDQAMVDLYEELKPVFSNEP